MNSGTPKLASRGFQLMLALTAPVALLLATAERADAIPVFARHYDMSCNTCHVSYPRLSQFGEQFASDMNMRLPNWKDKTVKTGDEMLALPREIPLAIRAQAFVQSREARAIDPVSGAVEADAGTDFQSPYLVKLLSAAPLTDHISYYFYGIFAEKGENGTVLIEDAWFSHDDVFGSGIGMQLGQFQVSDLMFPREQRLNFQDYMAYRFAGITYERGVIFGGSAGPVGIDVGIVNGNGISENVSINSPGYRRPDHLFDNNDDKSVFGRIGGDIGPVSAGLFVLSGKQANATGPAGLDRGTRSTDKEIFGIDLSGRGFGGNMYWYAQYLDNRWNGFIAPGMDSNWKAAFAGVDYRTSDHWTWSVLFNYGDAGDLAGSDTVYEGLEMRTLTFTASYYFMRNVKGIIELNADLLDEEAQSGLYYTGHLDTENYLLIGFDAAF